MDWLPYAGFWIIINTLIGWAIGNARGRAGAGVLFGLLLGPLGWLLVAVGPNPAKEQERKKAQAKQRYYAHKMLQRQAAATPAGGTPPPPTGAAPPPPGASDARVRIAKGGTELGEMTPDEVRAKIQTGELTDQDHYLDDQANDWLPIWSNDKLTG